jgi:hypothetical protein
MREVGEWRDLELLCFIAVCCRVYSIGAGTWHAPCFLLIWRANPFFVNKSTLVEGVSL